MLIGVFVRVERCSVLLAIMRYVFGDDSIRLDSFLVRLREGTRGAERRHSTRDALYVCANVLSIDRSIDRSFVESRTQ